MSLDISKLSELNKLMIENNLEGFLNILSKINSSELNIIYDGESMLFRACRHGILEFVSALLNAGSDILSHNSDGDTALHVATYLNNINLVKLLLSHGNRDMIMLNNFAHETPIHIACDERNLEILIAIHHFMIPSDFVDVCKQSTDSGYTPLDSAIISRNVDICRFLLDNGSDPNFIGDLYEEGLTPLHIAVNESNIDIMKLLLEKGAIINAHDNANETPLFWACAKENPEIAYFLLKKGALEITLESGESMFNEACSYENEKIILYFYERRFKYKLSDIDQIKDLVLRERIYCDYEYYLKKHIEEDRRERNWLQRKHFIMFLAQLFGKRLLPPRKNRKIVKNKRYDDITMLFQKRNSIIYSDESIIDEKKCSISCSDALFKVFTIERTIYLIASFI